MASYMDFCSGKLIPIAYTHDTRCHDGGCDDRNECQRYLKRGTGFEHASSLRDSNSECEYKQLEAAAVQAERKGE